MKRTVIILGSSEGKLYAEKLQNLLLSRFRNMSMIYDCVLWSEPLVWENGGVTLTSLINKARELRKEKGFAIALFTPDDKIELRNEEQYCSRDNIWLEYGLFVGIMDESRVFAVCPSAPVEKDGDRKKWRKPTDFQQYEMRYFYKDNLADAEDSLYNIAVEIADRINRVFPRELPPNDDIGPIFNTSLRRR